MQSSGVLRLTGNKWNLQKKGSCVMTYWRREEWIIERNVWPKQFPTETDIGGGLYMADQVFYMCVKKRGQFRQKVARGRKDLICLNSWQFVV